LIVNNNCTDETDEVIGRHEGRLPICRLFERRPGLSHARNCAVEHSHGEWIIWTDDDVLVDPGWLDAYVSAARRWPQAGYLGGSIEPWYECPPPAWVHVNLSRSQGVLVIRDLGSSERPFVGDEAPYGASMAFRANILRRIRFDPNLGLKQGEIILGDETALIEALRAENIQGIWVPSARARHFIPASRLSLAFLWKYFVGTGRTLARTHPEPLEGATWFGPPRWMYRRVVELWLSSAWN
jgi:glycosyltransferase involved in cell wall biosynthesis